MERLPETIDAMPVDEGIGSFRSEISELREDVESLRCDLRQLAALVKSARIVFGNAPGVPVQPANQESDKWERLKAKLGGKMSEIIEALQLTGTATRTQLKNQTGGALGTIDQAVYKLRDMGLLVRNGDGWSLKP
jgi:hypothetical protein